MNKKIAWGWLAAWTMGLVTAPGAVLAQEEVPAVEEAAATEAAEAAPAEAPPAEEAEPAAEEAAPAEAAAPVEEAVAAEESSDESSEGSSGGEGGGEGLAFYVGAEFVQTQVEINDDGLQAAFGSRRFDSDFYKLRLGMRIFEGVGIEFQGGVPGTNSSEDEVETAEYYGLFLVPTGVLFEAIEVSARLGYAMMSIENDAADEDLDGMSYAIGIELPIRSIAEGLPDLRLTAAGTVYQEDREARVYGYSVGLRYDFRI